MTNTKNIFNGKPIRAEYSTENSEWLFSIVDMCAALSRSENPTNYWSVMKSRLKKENSQTLTSCKGLKMKAPDGKMRVTDVVNKSIIIELAKMIKNSPHTDAFIEWADAFGVASKKYVLKHKDISVIEVGLDDNGAMASFGKVYNEAHLPVGTISKVGIDYGEIKSWWKNRSIPSSREKLTEMLQELGMLFPQQLLDKSFGLSLSDQYWISPIQEELKWASINFFNNAFSEDVGNMLFGGAINGSDANLVSPDNTSDGILKKKWKIINGKRCLIKGGTLPTNQEVANEVLATMICKRLSIPHIPYELLDIDGVKHSVCEDFITGETELVPAARIKCLYKKDNKTSDYEAYVMQVEKLGISDARLKTDMMLVLDYIMVNTDRHYNNFGVIRNADTLEWLSVAPIFDTGMSLWCRTGIDAESAKIEGKPFRGKMIEQIKFVKDFSWLNLDALNGIEDEFLDILNTVADPIEFEVRHKKLCAALRERIELFREIIARQQKKR